MWAENHRATGLGTYVSVLPVTSDLCVNIHHAKEAMGKRLMPSVSGTGLVHRERVFCTEWNPFHV